MDEERKGQPKLIVLQKEDLKAEWLFQEENKSIFGLKCFSYQDVTTKIRKQNKANVTQNAC